MKTAHKTIKTNSQFKQRVIFIITLVLVGVSLFGQNVEILGNAKITGTVEVMDTILFADGTELASACLQVLSDGDADTKIEVEQSSDEDIIRFTIDGNEIAIYEKNNMRLIHNGNSIFIGRNAGENDDGNNENLLIGDNAGSSIVSGSNNTILGQGAGASFVAGSNNVYLGSDAGSEEEGSDNTYIGMQAGSGSSGSGNVFLGHQAGLSFFGNNALIIANSASTNPLIYGEFDNSLLRINGRLNLNGNYEFPSEAGLNGQVLRYNGSGALQWVYPSNTTSLSDSDEDTKIQLEEGRDDDKIRFDVAGSELMVLDDKRLLLKNKGNSIFIGSAGGNDDGNNNNIGLGNGAGGGLISGSNNIHIGSEAGSEEDGSNNIFIGNQSGFVNGASENVFLGNKAGENLGGSRNTILGHSAGADASGNSNVFIGYDAGKTKSGNNLLVIDNADSPTPFIYGEFDNHKLEIDAWTQVKRRLDIDNNKLLFSNISTGNSHGIQWSSTTSPKFEMLYSNEGIGNERINMQFKQFSTARDLMTWDDSGNVGVGTQNPSRKLHVSADASTGHVMRIENTSSGSFASALEVVINRSTTGPNNNYVTFKDANSTAGRIEGFRVGEGPNFTDFPNIDINAYYDINAIANAIFDPGAIPTLDLNQLVYPSVDFNRGQVGTLQDNSTFNADNFIDNVLCITNPLCNHFDPGNISPVVNIDITNTGFVRPSLTFSPGNFPTWVEGQIPNFNLNAILYPEVRTSAYADIRTIANWALRNGIEAYNALDPFTNILMQDPEYWNNIALEKDGGVTYGSKGADYAEWLEREDPNVDMQAGQIVGVKNGKISLTTEGADQIMAISVMPIVLGNMPDSTRTEDFEKVAFIGQTPVWVVGDVKSGDYIIASSQNDGYGLAVSEEELTIEQLPLVVGRAWEDADNLINLVNMAVGLKTNEMAKILTKMTADFSELETRVDKIEAIIGSASLGSN